MGALHLQLELANPELNRKYQTLVLWETRQKGSHPALRHSVLFDLHLTSVYRWLPLYLPCAAELCRLHLSLQILNNFSQGPKLTFSLASLCYKQQKKLLVWLEINKIWVENKIHFLITKHKFNHWKKIYVAEVLDWKICTSDLY